MSSFSVETIPAALDHALNLFQNNRIQEAETVYKDILIQTPDHPEALHMLGVLAYSQSRFDEACRFMGEADRLHPAPPTHHLCNYAITLAALDCNEEAISVFQRALETDPNLYRAHGRMGQALLKMGRKGEAASAITRAIQLNPGYGDGYYFLGYLLLDSGRRDDALASFREALRLGLESAGTASLLGNAFNQLGCNQEALNCYRMAVSSSNATPRAGTMRRESNAVLRQICAPLTGRVLSIGSGNDIDKEGFFYREYFPESTAYMRIDFDSRNHPDIVGDAQNLRDLVPDHACDVVFSIWALEHIPDAPAALAEIHRILRPGGTFVFGLPLNVDFHSFPHDYHRFTLDGIRELFRGAFHIEEVYPIGKETPFTLDPRLSLFGLLSETAPASYVGLCRTI